MIWVGGRETPKWEKNGNMGGEQKWYLLQAILPHVTTVHHNLGVFVC